MIESILSKVANKFDRGNGRPVRSRGHQKRLAKSQACLAPSKRAVDRRFRALVKTDEFLLEKKGFYGKLLYHVLTFAHEKM